MVALNKLANFDTLAEGASGGTDANVDSVGGTAPLVYAASAIRGAKGVKFTAASGVASYLIMNYAATQTYAIACLYFKIDSTYTLPGVTDIVLLRNSAGNMARARLNADRTLTISDADVTARYTSPVLPTGNYVIGLSVTKGTTATNGRLASWLRNADTGALVSAATDVSGINTGTTAPANARFGKTSGGTTQTFDGDAIGIGWGTFGEPDFISNATPPTVNAGADFTDDSWDTLTLTATSSETDVVWSQVSGASAGLVDVGLTATGTLPPSLTTQTLVFRATATNSAGTATDDVIVTVTPATRAAMDGTPIRRATLDGTTTRTIAM